MASVNFCCSSIFFFFLICNFHSVFLEAAPSEDEYVRNVQAHLRIKDFQTAQDEVIAALHLYPHSKALWEVYVKVLARQGNEKEMIEVWKDYIDVFPEEKEQRGLVETLAWGVIDKASYSSSPVIRVMALLSAFLSQDSKGIEIVRRNLRDNNSAIRAVAVQLSANLRDEDIQDEIYRIFREEKVWNVRLEAIRSIGAMKIKKAQKELLDILKNPKSTAEESVAAIEALVEMWDTVTREGLGKLASSDRAGLRLLACQVAAHFGMKNDMDLILPLVNDHHAEVRNAALWALGNLRLDKVGGKSIVEIAEKKLDDIDPLVGVKAAWVITLNDPEKGQEVFRKWFKHKDRNIRITAAAHLAACGKYAFPLIIEQFQATQESYVLMNLALGLIGQRQETHKACFALYQGLQNTKERWAWDEKNNVKALVPSKLKHTDDLSNSPETIDQLTRLEILNILAIMKFSKAQQAIKTFLQQKTWGISAMAASTLLTEGDEEALELVQNLMSDEEMQIRVQAALILALWGGKDEALETLENAYSKVDRDMKERILEGIAKISSPKSIPFLLDRLHEPNQSLRVMAAAGLLICLYN